MTKKKTRAQKETKKDMTRQSQDTKCKRHHQNEKIRCCNKENNWAIIVLACWLSCDSLLFALSKGVSDPVEDLSPTTIEGYTFKLCWHKEKRKFTPALIELISFCLSHVVGVIPFSRQTLRSWGRVMPSRSSFNCTTKKKLSKCHCVLVQTHAWFLMLLTSVSIAFGMVQWSLSWRRNLRLTDRHTRQYRKTSKQTRINVDNPDTRALTPYLCDCHEKRRERMERGKKRTGKREKEKQ